MRRIVREFGIDIQGQVFLNVPFSTKSTKKKPIKLDGRRSRALPSIFYPALTTFPCLMQLAQTRILCTLPFTAARTL